MLELLATRNVLAAIDFSYTGCFVENVFTALSSSICDNLSTIRLAGNKFTRDRKLFRSVPAMSSWVQTVLNSFSILRITCLLLLGTRPY